MTASKNQTSGYKKIVKLMQQHRKMLSDAGCDEILTEQYQNIINYVSRNLLAIAPSQQSQLPLQKKGPRALSYEDIKFATTEYIDKLILDETCDRKTLELIAIERFHVPRGSMRSFGSIESLREKLRVLLENEKTHSAIMAVSSKTRT